MKIYPVVHKPWLCVASLVAVMLIASMVVSCDNAAQTTTASSTTGAAVVESTSVSTILPATVTHVQLSTRTPGPPPTDIPYPSPTLLLGMQASCQVAGYYPYLLRSCWRGTFNGELISVGAGRDRSVSDPNQTQLGVLIISQSPYLYYDHNPAIYYVPDGFGNVNIVSVSGTQITLAQAGYYGDPTPNGQTIIFDLATRQFQTVSGTPLPTSVPPTIPPHK